MARAYVKAAARCRQLEHVIRMSPGLTVGQLSASVGISYSSTCAYMQRLIREKRVDVVLEDPGPHNAKQLFYPLGMAPRPKKEAA